MSIFIFSNPIHSGKTSSLLQWCQQRVSITGIAMPDMDGIRNMIDLKTKEVFPAQCAAPEKAMEPLQQIGRFCFYHAAFEKANAILMQEKLPMDEWMIIDEVGKLEMEKKGFYPAVNYIIAKKKYRNLLLVVRDSLYASVIPFLQIGDHLMISNLNELPG